MTNELLSATRTLDRLADIYTLMADLLEDETGELLWFVGGYQVTREEGGITIYGPPHTLIHYAEPGAAGDYLVAVGCYEPGTLMEGRER
jgi:hypothetical protein